MLTREYVNSLLFWDRENGRFYWKVVPNKKQKLQDKEAGHLSTEGYWVIKINKRQYKRGRLCFFMEHGRFPVDCIDHKNGIKDDDRICNLREATITQNSWNHATRKKKTDLPMGVRLLANGKFGARIAHNKNKISLGAYKTIEQAEYVYKQKRRELYGEFAIR